MKHKQAKAVAVSVLLLFLSLIFIGGVFPNINVSAIELAQESTESFSAYLPLVSRDQLGIYGFVTDGGLPIEDIQVGLWLYDFDDETDIPIAETYTRSDGRYNFTAIPALEQNQVYYVWFRNVDHNPEYLGSKWTHDLLEYTAGEAIHFADFDIENVPLISPSDMIVASFPVTFQWAARTTSPYDTYRLFIENWDIFDFWFSSNLGYTDHLTLDELPPELQNDVDYLWSVLIYDPNGGGGESYETYLITFYDGLSSARSEPNLTREPRLTPTVHRGIIMRPNH